MWKTFLGLMALALSAGAWAQETPVEPDAACARAMDKASGMNSPREGLSEVVAGCADLFQPRLCQEAMQRAGLAATPEAILRLSLDGCAVAYCEPLPSPKPQWCTVRQEHLGPLASDYGSLLQELGRVGAEPAPLTPLLTRLQQTIKNLAAQAARERPSPPPNAPVLQLHGRIEQIEVELVEPKPPIQSWTAKLLGPDPHEALKAAAHAASEAGHVGQAVVLQVSHGVQELHLRWFEEGLPHTQVFVQPL